MRVVGIDPGIRGALAVIVMTMDRPFQVVDAIDIPTIGTKAKERINVHAIREWVLQHNPARCFLERGQAMPRQGASSGYKFGRAVGAIEATIALCNVPLEIIEPSMWKRALRLKGKDKEGSRQKALELFPHAQHLLARKKDHQRAEAMLIALYGAGTVSRATLAPAEPLTAVEAVS
jgi:crossover junction endodeoxyribonuclease RuvC